MPGPDCTEDARRCPNGIAHAVRLVSTRQYADLHCHATEQSIRELASSAVLDSQTKTFKGNTVCITIDCCVAGHEINE